MVRAAEAAQPSIDIAVDRGAEVPVGVQLAWALRARINDGTLAANERLPGSRELAARLDVNTNTVRAVYARLEFDGLIESRHGSGTFVRDSPPRVPQATKIAARAVEQARKAGVDPREVASALYVADRQAGTDVADPARQRRRLREQIAALQQAIDEIETEHAGLIAPTSDARKRSRTPRLPSIGELEAVRRELLERLASVQAEVGALSPLPPTRRRRP